MSTRMRGGGALDRSHAPNPRPFVVGWRTQTAHKFVLKCLRCEAQFGRDDESLPRCCPKCKSPYWNRRRKSEVG